MERRCDMKALIVDGQELFRVSLKELIHSLGRYDDVLEAESQNDFVAAASDPDVGLVVACPASVGLEEAACVRLAERLFPEARMVVFRDSNAAAAASGVISGRVKFLSREAGVREFLDALDGSLAVLDQQIGHMAGQPGDQATAGAGGAPPSSSLPSHAAVRNLSRRQREIINMVADGLANKEIAARLGIAEGTVKAHMHAVFKALGVTNRTQAVVLYNRLRQLH